jgi:hypothetical protein
MVGQVVHGVVAAAQLRHLQPDLLLHVPEATRQLADLIMTLDWQPHHPLPLAHAAGGRHHRLQGLRDHRDTSTAINRAARHTSSSTWTMLRPRSGVALDDAERLGQAEHQEALIHLGADRQTHKRRRQGSP